MSDILLVHESAQTLDVMRRIVSETGRQAVAAADGREAFAMCQAQGFSMVLVDVATKGIYAFDLVARLKALHKAPYVVLVASVYDKTAYKRAPVSLYGADDYLEQHHLPDKLPLIVAEVFASQVPNVTAETMAKQRETLQAAAGENPKSDAHTLARRVLLDISLYQGDLWAEGLKKGDLRERLKKQIAEAKEFLATRVPIDVNADALIEEALQALLREHGSNMPKGAG